MPEEPNWAVGLATYKNNQQSILGRQTRRSANRRLPSENINNLNLRDERAIKSCCVAVRSVKPAKL